MPGSGVCSIVQGQEDLEEKANAVDGFIIGLGAVAFEQAVDVELVDGGVGHLSCVGQMGGLFGQLVEFQVQEDCAGVSP